MNLSSAANPGFLAELELRVRFGVRGPGTVAIGGAGPG